MKAVVIETPRLILRPPQAEDLDGFCALMADEPSARFIGGVQPPEVVWRTLCVLAGAWTINGFSMFSVIERESGRWIGRLGPWQPLGWPGTEIAWGLLPSAQGKGLATEGASAAIDYAVDQAGGTLGLKIHAPGRRTASARWKNMGRVRTDGRCLAGLAELICRATRAQRGSSRSQPTME
ncbi:MAG: GNAT family N-acetyltransferase [Pannonibacter sp.]